MNRLSWLAAALVGIVEIVAPSWAGAEIYGWVDASGDVTYSNLPPPKGSRVFDVIEEAPPATPAQLQAAADANHQAELHALNSRVQQLERQLQQTRLPPPPAPYPGFTAPSSAAACDSDYFDCDGWSAPVYYTVGSVGPWRSFRRGEGHRHGSNSMRPTGGGPGHRGGGGSGHQPGGGPRR
jgi:Domain of unknown function (DUF4124)